MPALTKIPVSDTLRSRLDKPTRKRLEAWEAEVDAHAGRLLLHIDAAAAIKESPATSPATFAALQGSPLREEATAIAIAEADIRQRGAELLKDLEPFAQKANHEAIEASVKTRERVRSELTAHGVLPAGLNPAMIWHRSIRAAQETISERRAAIEQFGAWRRANEEATTKVGQQLERLKAAALQGVA